METLKTSPRVLIIGAGISGLHAASLLSCQGFDIQIFEAKAQVGGRIRAVHDLASVPLDIGAQFIHGKKSPHYKIAKEEKMRLKESHTMKTMIEYEGKLRDYGKVRKMRKCEYIETWEEEWEEEVTEEGEDMNMKDFFEGKKQYEGLEHYVEVDIANEWGTKMERISVKGVKYWDEMFEEYGFEDYIFEEGSNYELIMKRYKEIISKVKVNAPIVNVKENKGKIIVKSEKGEEYEGDFVIIAVPVTIIQKKVIEFEAGMISEKQWEAINKIEMGSITKVMLKFSKAFWPKDVLYIVIKGLVKCFWVAGLGEKRNVLVGSVSGDEAERIRKIGNEEVIKEILKDLQRNFGEEIVGAYEKGVILDWGKEEYIEAGYTYPGMKEVVGVTRQEARKAVGGNKVYFVGEWASVSGKFSSIGAAMESAEAVVEEISKRGKE